MTLPDQSMQPTHRDISNPNMVVMPPAHIHIVGFLHIYHMNNLYVLLSDWLQHQVLIAWLLKTYNIDFLYFSFVVLHFELMRKFDLTEFTLKTFPAVSTYVVVLSKGTFICQALFETVHVDVFHCSCALARHDQLVVFFVFFTQTNSAHGPFTWIEPTLFFVVKHFIEFFLLF